MKRLIFSIFAVAALSSCYEDKGNYDYSFDSLNKIDISNATFSPEAYDGESGKTIEIQTPLYSDLTQRVAINLDQSLADNYENLVFNWIRTTTKGEGSTAEEAVKDTVHSKGYIDLDFPVNTTMNYGLFLEIIDPSTSLAYYTKLTVKTRPLFQNSLFVLHGTTGNAKLGDVEIIGNEVKTRTDAYSVSHRDATDNPFQNTIGLGFSAYSYLVRGESGFKAGVSEELYVFNSDGTGAAYLPFKTLQEYNPADYVLPRSGSGQPFVFNSMIDLGVYSTMNDFKCIISQDGRFYTAGNIPCFHIPNEQVYDNPDNQTDYAVRAATITHNHFILWDAKYNRFLYQYKGSSNNEFGEYNLYPRYTAYMYNPVLNANVDFSSLQSLTPVGKTAVYAFIQSHRDLYEEAKPHFIFKDSNGKYYLYELTYQGGDKKSRANGSDAAYSITGQEMTGFTPQNERNILFNLWFDNYLFYTDGENIYRYNTENGDATLLYTVPSGYEVSVMKFRTTSADSYNNTNAKFGDLGLYLSIGLNKGSEGAIAEIKLTTAGDVDTSFSLFRDKDDDGNKFGNIMDLQFAHLYNYNVSY